LETATGFRCPVGNPQSIGRVGRRPRRLRTRDGKARYAKRKATVETVFGIIKHVPGQPLSSCCAACVRCNASG
jgi:hypothetical protein